MAIFVVAFFVMIIVLPRSPKFIPRDVAVVVCIEILERFFRSHVVVIVRIMVISVRIMVISVRIMVVIVSIMVVIVSIMVVIVSITRVVVVIMTIFFHPHMACCFTVCLSGVVGVLVSCGVVTVIAFVAIVVVFFHPDEAAGFTIYFVVDVVVCVIGHIVTNAVLITVFITVLIAVFIAVFIAMVAMVVVGVTAKHLEGGHCEMFWTLSVEFNDVFTLFKMEDRNHGVCWTSGRICNGLFCFKVAMAFMLVMGIICMVIFTCMVILICMIVMLFLSKRDVESSVFCVDFDIISMLLFINEFDHFERSCNESLAQVRGE